MICFPQDYEREVTLEVSSYSWGSWGQKEGRTGPAHDSESGLGSGVRVKDGRPGEPWKVSEGVMGLK